MLYGVGILSNERRNLSPRPNMHEASSLCRLIYASPQLIKANSDLNLGLHPRVYTNATELKQDTLCWNCHSKFKRSAATRPRVYGNTRSVSLLEVMNPCNPPNLRAQSPDKVTISPTTGFFYCDQRKPGEIVN